MKLNITLFESIVLLTICAILIWANLQVRVVRYEFHSKVLGDGAIEYYCYGWPFTVNFDFNEPDALRRRGDIRQWRAKETAGNVAVAFAILASTFVALRLLRKAFSTEHKSRNEILPP